MPSRRGRPPKVVTTAAGDLSVEVRGARYDFRRGEDGRLRALGTPDRESADYAYAKERVERFADPTV